MVTQYETENEEKLMNVQGKALHFWMQICRFNFGTFEKEESKKFLRMGIIFAPIIETYWTLISLKESIFIQLIE